MKHNFCFALTALAATFALSFATVANAQQPAPPGPARSGAKVSHPIVTMQTTKGTILIKLFPEEAPKTVENFIKLINKKFYDGLTFHRVEPGFVVQGGDPQGNGKRRPRLQNQERTNKTLKHNRGAVAMANAGRDTAGSQFYFVITKPAPHLDSGDYTIFGQVISGQDVAEKMAVGDKMTKVTVKN
jgi:peptidyl-prolyl cis-trans isomerase B (cyclophilin B)